MTKSYKKWNRLWKKINKNNNLTQVTFKLLISIKWVPVKWETKHSETKWNATKRNKICKLRNETKQNMQTEKRNETKRDHSMNSKKIILRRPRPFKLYVRVYLTCFIVRRALITVFRVKIIAFTSNLQRRSGDLRTTLKINWKPVCHQDFVRQYI